MNADKEYAGTVQTNEMYNENVQGGAEAVRPNTAAYIEDLLRELETIAAKEKIEPLRDLLRIAKEEARRKARSS